MSTNLKGNTVGGRGVSNTYYIRNRKTISGRLHDELVMMNIEQGKYFSLNPVATRVWDMLERPVLMDELCDLLMDEYEVGFEQCHKEVDGLLAEMVRLDIVNIVYLP